MCTLDVCRLASRVIVDLAPTGMVCICRISNQLPILIDTLVVKIVGHMYVI